MTFNRLQRQHMAVSEDASVRVATALEGLNRRIDALLVLMGGQPVLDPEPGLEPEPNGPATAPAHFNPHTESAPGQPLPGQENE